MRDLYGGPGSIEDERTRMDLYMPAYAQQVYAPSYTQMSYDPKQTKPSPTTQQDPFASQPTMLAQTSRQPAASQKQQT